MKHCAAQSPQMELYKPTFESIHKLIYEKVSKRYGATTFWTKARHPEHSADNNENTMFWM
jgi:hypothetical protein